VWRFSQCFSEKILPELDGMENTTLELALHLLVQGLAHAEWAFFLITIFLFVTSVKNAKYIDYRRRKLMKKNKSKINLCFNLLIFLNLLLDLIVKLFEMYR